MGAAVAIELRKPLDASDIQSTNNLKFAINEVVRLRSDLGHLAKEYGVDILSFDATDIVFGENDEEDFHRCVQEISHIRKCLNLNTQTSKRRSRKNIYVTSKEEENENFDSKESDSDYSDTEQDS